MPAEQSMTILTSCVVQFDMASIWPPEVYRWDPHFR